MHTSRGRTTVFAAAGAFLWLAAGGALAPAPAGSGVPPVIAFQGYLTNDLGAPIDGIVTLDVGLYESESKGPVLWTESHPNVFVASGIFTLELGSTSAFPDSLFERSELWLGVGVDGGEEMPRTPLRATPFAFRARNADRLQGLESDVFVRASGDTISGVIRLEGGVAALEPGGGVTEVVASTSDVLLRRYHFSPDAGSWSDVVARVVLVVNGVPSAGAGVATITRDQTTVAVVDLEESGIRPWTYAVDVDLDDDVTLDVAVRASIVGFPVFVRSLVLDTFGAGEMPVVLTLDDVYDAGGTGAGRSITADAGSVEITGPGGLTIEGPLVSSAAPGDTAVVLPDSSVSHVELLDETGVAETRVAGNTVITDSVVEMLDVAVVTVTTPADGYIQVEGTAQARFSASTTGNVMAVQIDETSGGVIDVIYYHFAGWESDSPADESYQNVHVTRTYFKPAGTHTFRLEAMDHDDQGSKSLWNVVLVATFHPTAYGPVISFVEPGQGEETVHVEGNGGPSGDADRIDLRSLERPR